MGSEDRKEFHSVPDEHESDQECYHALAFYSLSHAGASFIHQHVVDAYTAQHVSEETKPIAAAFALIGLYLHVECGYSGREVQRAHRQLAGKRKSWPKFDAPQRPGDVSVSDVVSAPPGTLRDQAIEEWCAAVWTAWHGSRDLVRALVHAGLDGGEATRRQAGRGLFVGRMPGRRSLNRR